MAAGPPLPKPPLSKDTRLCISLAGRPSNLGTRFHNRLYDELGLDFVYKAFTTDDIAAAIGGVRALGIRGCSVSMPFKAAVLPLVDRVEASAADIEAANTIVNDDGVLTAANTDAEAVAQLLADQPIERGAPVMLRGSGSMASAVLSAFRSSGFTDLTVVARNEAAGRALAERDGARFRAEPGAGDVLVNVTPLGMTGADAGALAFQETLVRQARLVVDVVATPAETPLTALAAALGVPVVTGTQVHALQATLQFERYTGVRPTPAQIAAAGAYSRE